MKPELIIVVTALGAILTIVSVVVVALFWPPLFNDSVLNDQSYAMSGMTLFRAKIESLRP
jgi:hypothetical protein